MSVVRIGINGLGRIGRLVLRWAAARHARADHPCATRRGPALEIVAANDLLDRESLAYLCAHDSVHGRAPGPVAIEGDRLRYGPLSVALHQERDPAAIPWSQHGVDVVLECTGRFASQRAGAAHLGAARWAVLAQPGEADATVVVGVNEEVLASLPARALISAASCTTHATSPILAVLERGWGIRWGLVGTIHAYTAGQALVDGASGGKDLRRLRAAAINIVPTSTGAASALVKVLPGLAGKLAGSAIRVPVANVSMWDVTCLLERPCPLADALAGLREAARSSALAGIIEVSDAPLVSSDLVGSSASSVVDVDASYEAGPLLRLQGWYDNEAGYAARLLDLAALAAR